jgi:transcriptional regulator with XRE-family HTH domain
MSFGQHLRALRGTESPSRPALARRARVPVSTLRNWEGDQGLPSIPAWLRLAEALGVPVERWAEGLDDPRPGGASRTTSESTPAPEREDALKDRRAVRATPTRQLRRQERASGVPKQSRLVARRLVYSAVDSPAAEGSYRLTRFEVTRLARFCSPGGRTREVTDRGVRLALEGRP